MGAGALKSILAFVNNFKDEGGGLCPASQFQTLPSRKEHPGFYDDHEGEPTCLSVIEKNIGKYKNLETLVVDLAGVGILGDEEGWIKT